MLPRASHSSLFPYSSLFRSVTVNSGSVCTATVTDTSATGATTPTGSVSFASDGTGTFSLSGGGHTSAAGAPHDAVCAITNKTIVVGTATVSFTAPDSTTSNL